MAIPFSDVQTICQEAFYILRQDATVLTEANWSAGTPIEVAKCKIAVETAVHEVLDAFMWSGDLSVNDIPSWPYAVRNAVVYCLARELAIPIAGRIEDMKNYDALYRDKLMQAMLRELNEALSSNGDPVLAEMLMNFKSDDPGMVKTFAIYTRRASVVKETATNEVNAAHDWIVPFETGNSEHRAYAAWIDLCCAKLAAACGLDANHASLYEKRYAERLQTARAADLEEAKSGITDADTKSVLAMISTNFVPGDGLMPRNIKAITDRIDQLKEMARREVLSAHEWNFSKVVERCADAMPHDGNMYSHATPYPRRALRLIAVYGCDGKLVEWKVENGYIRARSRIDTVKFVMDVTDTSRWVASVRRAYLLRLSADVARTVMNNAQEAVAQEAKYAQALEEAKLRDTREGNTPTDAWGPNHYVEMMRGARRRPWED